ncbi:glycoside hydrolase family 10 protein [Paludisphaera rhizosphaerae]|uniref:glycoside hydrolase family 10 protein n=1 Tax=Paludisphaera rhizosphaerae TaxID=2711216 RepID=UPI0013EE342C|nr:family 10 glycosylhydrolase [Paludisphaera rhizosphaerae]
MLATMLAVCANIIAAPPEPPPIPREFRSAWIATVDNIDWPSKPGLPADQQQNEARAILDRLKASNFNAAILQVRPATDALYPSELEPWSYYLTGTEGKAPEPGYDPLKFWIDEAHARGIQLHAWFNPFRARQGGAKHEHAASHVSKAHPERVRRYGKLLWMDPGDPEARKQTLDVVMDVVRRYDVDGVHIDDYFYPYPESDPQTKVEIDFPDDATWSRENKGNDPAARADWRRANMSTMVHTLYEAIKQAKPHVLFGISPFGVPRPGKPAGVVGFDQYAKLYADTETWLTSGWLDYWTPQLYWKIDSPGQPFGPLLNYWIEINKKGRHVWPGLYASKYEVEEIVNQIKLVREAPGDDGVAMFSMKTILKDRRNLATSLAEGLFREPALVPASPWLGDKAPQVNGGLITTSEGGLSASTAAGEPAASWLIQRRKGDVWTTEVVYSPNLYSTLMGCDAVVVTPISRTGVAGPSVAGKPFR